MTCLEGVVDVEKFSPSLESILKSEICSLIVIGNGDEEEWVGAGE